MPAVYVRDRATVFVSQRDRPPGHLDLPSKMREHLDIILDKCYSSKRREQAPRMMRVSVTPSDEHDPVIKSFLWSVWGVCCWCQVDT